MGPNKKTNQRTSRSRSNFRVENSISKAVTEIAIDLTSEERNINKTEAVMIKVDEEDQVGQFENERLQCLPKEDHNMVSNHKQRSNGLSVKKSNHLPSVNQSDTRTEKDQDDSAFDEDLLLESQLSSQDNLLLESSQDGDQCDVKWDYSSPDTMKQLKKMRGKYSAQDVKRIIANFPDVPAKPVPTPLHYQLKYTMPFKSAADIVEKNKIHKAKQRAAKKWQRSERCKAVVEDMIVFLQQQQKKQEKNSKKDGPLEVSTERNLNIEEKTNENLSEFQDTWLDDDLFQDNSFLIEATQNLERILPLINSNPVTKSSSDKSSKTLSDNSSDTFSSAMPSQPSLNSIIDSTSVIPSSYAGNLRQKASTITTKSISGHGTFHNIILQSTNESRVHHVNNVNKSKQSIHNGNNATVTKNNAKEHLNNGVQSSYNQAGLPSTQRTLFRRHHTFQDKQNEPCTNISSPSLNSPFRRCLSFDDSQISKSKTLRSDTSTRHKHPKALPSYQNISFDSSLSDDLLLQASEVVDSVCDYPLVKENTTVHYNGKSKTTVQSSSYSSLSSEFNKDNMNITNTLLSPVRPLKQDSIMKRLHLKHSNSPVQSFFKKSFSVKNHQAMKHKTDAGPNSTSTPVKMAKTTDDIDYTSHKLSANKESDSFMDDSFMNDDALFESQILPILELAETQVTTKKNYLKCPSKYSPEEIERKRQAALQKLQKNDLVHHSQENTTKHNSPRDPEQCQMSLSPRKCSQEEINKKKQAAQRKLLQKTNSAGSIQMPKDITEESINNDKALEKEIKCSQDVIKMKRDEAFRIRRLKLLQVSKSKNQKILLENNKYFF